MESDSSSSEGSTSGDSLAYLEAQSAAASAKSDSDSLPALKTVDGTSDSEGSDELDLGNAITVTYKQVLAPTTVRVDSLPLFNCPDRRIFVNNSTTRPNTLMSGIRTMIRHEHSSARQLRDDDVGSAPRAQIIARYPDDITYMYMAQARGVTTTEPAAYRTAGQHNLELGVILDPQLEAMRCLAQYVEFNGVRAYALFDSRSTTTLVTPDFACVANLCTFELEHPVTLYLGYVGSRSKINFGVIGQMSFGSVRDGAMAIHVVNMDHYDCVIGADTRRKYGMVLDFKERGIRMGGTWVPTFVVGEEADLLVQRRQCKVAACTKQAQRCSGPSDNNNHEARNGCAAP
ncbi:unnamed protein product [Peniophora sp. CBMAI 1063]|nr:unnamed protein product [Peniophora sp. CBMAI 1063]